MQLIMLEKNMFLSFILSSLLLFSCAPISASNIPVSTSVIKNSPISKMLSFKNMAFVGVGISIIGALTWSYRNYTKGEMKKIKQQKRKICLPQGFFNTFEMTSEYNKIHFIQNEQPFVEGLYSDEDYDHKIKITKQNDCLSIQSSAENILTFAFPFQKEFTLKNNSGHAVDNKIIIYDTKIYLDRANLNIPNGFQLQGENNKLMINTNGNFILSKMKDMELLKQEPRGESTRYTYRHKIELTKTITFE